VVPEARHHAWSSTPSTGNAGRRTDLTLEAVFTALQDAEGDLGRRVSPTLYTGDEFRRRRRSSHPFSREPAAQAELDGLLRSGAARIKDAENEQLSAESRFDLACNAAHAFSLAALRFHGYQ